MRFFATFLFIATIPLIAISQQKIEDDIWHDDSLRSYILHIPSNYDETVSVPMVFNLHSYGSYAYKNYNAGYMQPISNTEGFIIVYPQGRMDKKGVPHWNVGEWIGDSVNVDDVGFLSALIDSIKLDYNIDLERIYSIGYSNGGYMSFHLACQLSNRIAAISSVAGSMTYHTYNTCNSDRPIPILKIHGTEDDGAHLEGSPWSKPVDDVLQYWVNYNNCNPNPTIISIPDIDTANKVTVEKIIYSGGDDNANVEYFKIIGGAHTWNGLPWGETNDELNTSEEIWSFLSRYDINGLIGSTTSEDVISNNEYIQIFPNPAKTKITIEFSENSTGYNELVEIYNIQGQLVQREPINNIHQCILDINISRLNNGVYVLRKDNMNIRFCIVK